MTNMGYCRFRNTENDLDDCIYALQEADLPQSEEECRAALRMQIKAKLFIELMEEHHEDIAAVTQQD